MKNSNVKTLYLWLLGIAIIAILCVLLLLFSEAQIPANPISSGLVAIFSAFIGVMLTAFAVSIQLQRQSQTEAQKEKDVKIFETRKEKYDNFINEVWKIWDTRSVRLEDVNGLLRMVSQDIVLYTSSETVNKILYSLTQIADYANRKDSDNTDKLQGHIFDIINSLAKEIKLGGGIEGEVRENINALEDKLLPYIRSKEYVKKLNELVRSKIPDLEKFEYKPDETSSNKNILWWHIDKGMYLRVGDQWADGKLFFSFWAEFYRNRQYQGYRLKVRGNEKNWMNACHHISNFAKDKYQLNFNDFRDGKPLPPDALENLAEYITVYFKAKYTEFGNKDIIDLIEECNK